MPETQVKEFRHICALCATRGTDVFRLAAKRRMDPMELLQTINGKVVPTKVVISGLAKELHSSVFLLTKLATEIKPGKRPWLPVVEGSRYVVSQVFEWRRAFERGGSAVPLPYMQLMSWPGPECKPRPFTTLD